MRRLRASAADHYDLASGAFSESVRARYLAIADHYTSLAEAEFRSDRLERQRRLLEMQAKRAAARARTVPHAAPEPVKLRLIQGAGPKAGKRRTTLPARWRPSLAGFAAKRER